MRSTLVRFVVLGVVAAGLIPAGASSGQPVGGDAEWGSSDWRTVVAGDNHTCGIRTTGRLYCWGRDDRGQLGDGGGIPGADRSTPVQVAGGHTDWTQVDLGGFHTCGRRSNGRLYCWGSDESGQVGDGGTIPGTDRTAPTQVAGGHADWTAVTAGFVHTCGRRSNGRLFCWGSDGDGRLGNGGADTSRSQPVQVAGGVTTWTNQITAGAFHTCGRRSPGRLFCWGSDESGQVGDGGVLPGTTQTTPRQVAGGHSTWTSVSAGRHHTCARRTTGRLYCWGSDDNGRLGNGGADANRAVPVEVAGGHTTWTSVTTGNFHTCALRSNGRIFCWGGDGDGQLGAGGAIPGVDRSSPTQVVGGATDWRSVTTSSNHTCARIVSLRIFCWGRDADSQLGDGGTDTDQSGPTPVRA